MNCLTKKRMEDSNILLCKKFVLRCEEISEKVDTEYIKSKIQQNE